MNNEGPIRRTDLYLRAKYPELITSIYRIEKNRFEIFCQNAGEDFTSLKKEFNYSIKMMTAPVELVNVEPSVFLEEISPIKDTEISKGFEGVPMTKVGLLNLLISKFPNVNFHRISDSAGVVNIHLATFDEKIGDTTYHRFLNNKDRKGIETFLEGLKTNIKFNLIEEKFEERPIVKDTPHNPVQFIYAANLRKEITREYSLRDESLWYDNLDKVYEGKFTKDNLYFYNSGEYSCYVDYSSFPNIDLRNHLFLFQTVYITPPYEKDIASWLKESKITDSEFHELVKRGRIKVILTQPEFRYDVGFVDDIYSHSPDSVITRRALSCLQQIDIVEISNNYLLNDINVIGELKDFCLTISEHTEIDSKFLYDILIWPIKARRNSFEYLNTSGLLGLSSYGVNKAIDKKASDTFKKDLEFEFTVNSPAIHLANSLNSIYFPFKAEDGYSDVYYVSAMGELLNFYKSASTTHFQAFIKNKQKLNSGIPPISPIDIIELNDYIPITELEEVLSADTVTKSKKLMEHLAELDEDERSKKILHYNQQIEKLISKKKKNAGVIDLGSNILTDTAGALSGFAPLGTAISLLKLSGKGIRKSLPLVKNIAHKIEDALNRDTDKANIHFLTRINRVARLKRN